MYNEEVVGLAGRKESSMCGSRFSDQPVNSIGRSDMRLPGPAEYSGLPDEYFDRLYRRHRNAALIRSGASLVMWLFALATFLTGVIKTNHLLGVSLSVSYLILINPPTLWILKKSKSPEVVRRISILINLLEIAGYSAIIYSTGGIEATYLTPIYAALILYIGAYATRTRTFLLLIRA